MRQSKDLKRFLECRSLELYCGFMSAVVVVLHGFGLSRRFAPHNDIKGAFHRVMPWGLIRFELCRILGYTRLMEIEIIQAIQSIHSNVVLFLTTFVSYFSSWIGFVFILITFLLFARFRFALTFAIASGVVSGVVNIVKVVVQRPRPWVESETVANLLEASGYSMPSGHTANSVVIAVFLCYFFIRTLKNKPLKISLCVLSGVYVLAVMFSRMFLGQHYLSDVCVGFLVSGLISVVAIVVYDRFIRPLNIKRKRKQ